QPPPPAAEGDAPTGRIGAGRSRAAYARHTVELGPRPRPARPVGTLAVVGRSPARRGVVRVARDRLRLLVHLERPGLHPPGGGEAHPAPPRRLPLDEAGPVLRGLAGARLAAGRQLLPLQPV